MIVTIENVKRAREILRLWRENGVEYFRCFEGDDRRQKCEPCKPDSDPIVYKMPEESDIYTNPIKKICLLSRRQIPTRRSMRWLRLFLMDGRVARLF
jgi:hypothetical protein